MCLEKEDDLITKRYNFLELSPQKVEFDINYICQRVAKKFDRSTIAKLFFKITLFSQKAKMRPDESRLWRLLHSKIPKAQKAP